MNKVFSFICGILMSVNLAFSADDANSVVKKADRFRNFSKDVSFIVEINDSRDGEMFKTKYKVVNRGVDLSRIDTVYPERQIGRRLLMRKNDLWFFTTDIKRPTRVSMQQKLTGEVANGDIARTNFSQDYSAKLLGEEMAESVPCLKLKLTQLRSDVTYPSIDYYVSKKDFQPIKAVFKTKSNKALKTALYKNVQTALGQKTITQILIVSETKKSNKSQLDFSNFKSESLDESFFNKESLDN